jgi:hypothetical protein
MNQVIVEVVHRPKPGRNGGVRIVKTPVAIVTEKSAGDILQKMIATKGAGIETYEVQNLPNFGSVKEFNLAQEAKVEQSKADAAKAAAKAFSNKLTADQRAALSSLTPQEIAALVLSAPEPAPTTPPAAAAPAPEVKGELVGANAE